MLSFFPLDVLDEIWDVIESVSEGFLPTFARNAGLKDQHKKAFMDKRTCFIQSSH